MQLGTQRLEHGNLLLPFEPFCHLRAHIHVVRCMPCLLCTVNVQPLKHLGVIIVCGTKALNRVNVADKRMELWNVKVLMDMEHLQN